MNIKSKNTKCFITYNNINRYIYTDNDYQYLLKDFIDTHEIILTKKSNDEKYFKPSKEHMPFITFLSRVCTSNLFTSRKNIEKRRSLFSDEEYLNDNFCNHLLPILQNIFFFVRDVSREISKINRNIYREIHENIKPCNFCKNKGKSKCDFTSPCQKYIDKYYQSKSNSLNWTDEYVNKNIPFNYNKKVIENFCIFIYKYYSIMSFIPNNWMAVNVNAYDFNSKVAKILCDQFDLILDTRYSLINEYLPLFVELRSFI